MTAGRTRGETRGGALLFKLESLREEMYAFDMDNAPYPGAPYPGESGFGFRSPIGLHVGQAECIPQDWADIQKSEFHEDIFNAMRLELEGHNGIGTFLADVVPKRVNAITAKGAFAWNTDSDGYIKKAQARLVANGFGQQSGVDYFNTFAPTPTGMLSKLLFKQNSTPTFT